MQQELELNKLYELLKVKKVVINDNLGVDSVKGESYGDGSARICIYGGTANIYCSDKLLGEPASTSDMILDKENISGIRIFGTLPDFIYITGTATEIVVSGAIYDEVEGGF